MRVRSQLLQGVLTLQIPRHSCRSLSGAQALDWRPVGRPAQDRMRDDEEVRIEILHIDACPTWAAAAARVRHALAASGLTDGDVEYRLLRTSEDAAGTPFAGSPTILLDGNDLFPSDGRTSELACRVYATPSELAGSPTTRQLIEARSPHGR